MEHTVEVWGERHPSNVYQRSKSVWIAAGEYEGKRIEVKGRSAPAAMASWRAVASYRATD